MNKTDESLLIELPVSYFLWHLVNQGSGLNYKCLRATTFFIKYGGV